MAPQDPLVPAFIDCANVSDGTVPITGKNIVFDVPPPGTHTVPGVTTVIQPVPEFSSIAAETNAVSVVDDMYVVASCDVP